MRPFVLSQLSRGSRCEARLSYQSTTYTHPSGPTWRSIARNQLSRASINVPECFAVNAAPFGEQLEPLRRRVIPPDALLEFDPANPGGDGAPLGPVKPAVGAELHRVHGGVRVLQPEAAEEDLRVAVRLIVVVFVRVKQQV